MNENLQEALSSVVWYAGHYEWLEEFADKLEKSNDIFYCPFEVDKWHSEQHVIYMLLVGMFGNWGTSIRSGWIEETKACAEYIRELCKDMKELEELNGG